MQKLKRKKDEALKKDPLTEEEKENIKNDKTNFYGKGAKHLNLWQ